MKTFFDLCKERGIKPYFKHGIWFPVIDDVKPVVKIEDNKRYSNPQTPFERMQFEKYGNFFPETSHVDHDEWKDTQGDWQHNL